MSVKFSNLKTIKIELGLEPNGKVQSFATNTCAKHNDKYVPYRTGTLANEVEIKSNEYIYNQEYASYVYYGISASGKDLKYNTEKHELAGPYWDERMWSAEKEDIIKEIQNFVGGGK